MHGIQFPTDPMMDHFLSSVCVCVCVSVRAPKVPFGFRFQHLVIEAFGIFDKLDPAHT